MRNWRTIVPLGALAVLALGFVASKVSVRREAPLEISPPPAATLAAIPFPARELELRGRVVAAGGAGVPEALLWLRAGDEPHWTYTGDDGSYRLDSLAAGPWTAFVLARGFAPRKIAIEGASESLTIDLGPPLEAAPSLAKLERSPLAGRVVSPLATDLAGCEVVLIPVLPPETIGAPVPRRANVDRAGRFAFEDLIAGAYRIEVRPAWARGGSWPDLARPLTEPAARVLEHPSGDVEIPLACGEMRGAVADPDGAPIEGALVFLGPAGDPNRIWPPRTTSADGTFYAGDLPAGDWAVGVRAGSGRAEQTVAVSVGSVAEPRFAGVVVRRAH